MNGWIKKCLYCVVHDPFSYFSDKSFKIIIFIYQVFRESEDDANHQLVHHLVSTLSTTYQLHTCWTITWYRILWKWQIILCSGAFRSLFHPRLSCFFKDARAKLRCSNLDQEPWVCMAKKREYRNSMETNQCPADDRYYSGWLMPWITSKSHFHSSKGWLVLRQFNCKSTRELSVKSNIF